MKPSVFFAVIACICALVACICAGTSVSAQSCGGAVTTPIVPAAIVMAIA
jgi:hypothetical protein